MNTDDDDPKDQSISLLAPQISLNQAGIWSTTSNLNVRPSLVLASTGRYPCLASSGGSSVVCKSRFAARTNPPEAQEQADAEEAAKQAGIQ